VPLQPGPATQRLNERQDGQPGGLGDWLAQPYRKFLFELLVPGGALPAFESVDAQCRALAPSFAPA